jgi:hypothetical protein
MIIRNKTTIKAAAVTKRAAAIKVRAVIIQAAWTQMATVKSAKEGS